MFNTLSSSALFSLDHPRCNDVFQSVSPHDVSKESSICMTILCVYVYYTSNTAGYFIDPPRQVAALPVTNILKDGTNKQSIFKGQTKTKTVAF